MAIVLIAIGLLFTGVDFMVGSGISYPDFIQPTGFIMELISTQEYSSM